MKTLRAVVALVTASLVSVAVESAGPDQTFNNGAAAPPVLNPMYNNVPAPGWYPPPRNRGWYAQPWQQPPGWSAPPRAYNQPPPAYPAPAYQRPEQARAGLPAPTPPVNPLSAELKQTQEQLAASRAELESAQATLEQVQGKLQQSLETEQALNDKAATAAGEQQTLQARMTELSQQLDASSTTLEELRAQLADTLADNQALVTERDQLQSDLAGRDAQLADLQSELETANQALQQARTETTRSGEQLTAAKEQAGKLQSELVEVKTRLDSIQSAELNSEQALTGENEKLRAELASRDKQLDSLKKELQTSSAALQVARDGASASGKQLGEVQAHTDQIKSELDELNAQLEDQQSTLVNAEKTLREVIAERDTLQAELAARDQALSQAQDKLANVQAERDALRPVASAGDGDRVADIAEKVSEPAMVEIAALETAGLDSDADGVRDSMDLCRETAAGVAVDSIGCAAGTSISLEGVNFRYNSQDLTEEAQDILDRVAAILRQNNDLRLQISGHTDTQGDPAYNQWLSLQRAETVKNYLVEQGVKARYLGAVGYGGQRPIADNSTREGLRMNRRVELQSLR